MAYLDRKLGNNQQNINNNQSVELNPEAVVQLERLLNLLTDLNLINFPVELTEESIKPEEQKNLLATQTNQTEENHNLIHQSITKNSAENEDDVIDVINFLAELPEEFIESKEQRNLLITETDRAEKNHNSIHQSITKYSRQNYDNVINLESQSTKHQQEIPTREKPLFIPEKLSELSGCHQQNDAELEAFEALQNLLFGSQVARLIRKLNTNLKKQNFNDRQDELKNLFNPLLLENLFTHLGQTEGEVLETITPVIDEAIQKRFRQDRGAISSALAPILSPAIAIQINQDPQVMAEALAPIIDVILIKKTEQDQQSIIEVLAPLFPVIISYVIQNYPQEIAKALAPEMGAAIREQIKIDKRQISQALAPEMGTAIKEQIFLEQNSIVDALYPVIGSTISKYMTEAIREINEKISDTFSFKGIRRKIQAIFRGVSEAELIISEIMVFAVQAVFLIHKESGLVIAEAQQSGREKLESEMVAGMLTAIRSFVNDCIVQSGDVSELNEIEYGDSKIILEVVGYCYLAVVIKGEPSKSFIKELRQTLTNIVIDYGKDIKNFAGDPDTIPSSIKLQLKGLLDVDVQENENKKLSISKPPTALLIVGGLVASLILIPWGIYQYYSRLYRSVEVKTTQAWANAPELAFYSFSLNAEVKRGSLTLTGKLPNQNLLDRAVEIAKEQANFSNLDLELDNQIVAIKVPPDPWKISGEVERITKALNQIEGVSISSNYTEDKVTVKGTVMDMADVEKITKKIEQVPGVESVTTTIKLDPLKVKERIYFARGSAKLESAYAKTIADIKEFLSQYPQENLRIIGHTDRTGNPNINKKLALRRANVVRYALVKEGVDARRLKVTGQINSPQDVESNQPLLLSRCVTFDLFKGTAKDN
ncbi:MAG: OmpA family protein [Okeania sp. SIO3I5]|uniref:OmpA family protein n=1 Tax=Okeania sp. SIO3I5 TaxID=2607805 RepID=UPI0013B70BA6|nr:OmpA family protein [Okeania sp. SIO3I5]NEQ36226.1 OmpA family protein [Okeania sp. SIO3I5]